MRHTSRPVRRVRSRLMPPELAGVAELAKLLDVDKRTVQRYTHREDFPAPVEVLAGGRRVWRRRDVERWAAKTLPLPRTGRPPKQRG